MRVREPMRASAGIRATHPLGQSRDPRKAPSSTCRGSQVDPETLKGQVAGLQAHSRRDLRGRTLLLDLTAVFLDTRADIVRAFPPKSPSASPRLNRPKDPALDLLPHIELTTGADPVATIIWLHGLGADGWDFVPIVRELPLPEDLALRFIFPHAPVQAVTINGGAEMRAWYDIKMNDISRCRRGRYPRIAGGRRAAARSEIAGHGARGSCSGFSQGAPSRCRRAAHAKRRGGIAALSLTCRAESLEAEASSANRAKPIFRDTAPRIRSCRSSSPSCRARS